MSVYKRDNGTWTASVSYLNPDKKSKTKYKKLTKSGLPNVTAAREAEIELKIAAKNIEIEKTELTFYEEFKRWVEAYKLPNLRSNSKGVYKIALAFINRFFSGEKMGEISGYDFQVAFIEYALDHAPSSCRKIKGTLRAFYDYKIDEGEIHRNPVKSVKITKGNSRHVSVKFLEYEDFEKLISSVYHSDSAVDQLILTACLTGCRVSELQGLQRKDFDFKNNLIHINKGWNEHLKELSETKTKTSIRDIDVPSDFMQVAKTWKNDSNFMFSNDIYPVYRNSINLRINALMEKNNINSRISIHSLRHSHASYLFANDISIQYVSERLGHSSVDITLKIYAHLLNKKRSKEKAKAVELLGKATKKEHPWTM